MPRGVVFDEAAFAKVVNRYKGAAGKTRLVQTGLVKWAMGQGILQAKREIDTLVYDAPAPASGDHRTGATRRAIGPKGAAQWWGGTSGASGIIHVDRTVANRKGFYYPAVLNKGRTDIHYYPRPFWTATKAVMKARYAAQGRVALRELAQALRTG